MKRLMFIPCLLLCVQFVSVVGWANDLDPSLEGHWVSVIPEVLGHVDDQSFDSFSVYTDQNDYAVFDILKDDSETSVLCHYHIDNDSSHCNIVESGYEQTGNFELVVSISQDDVYQLLSPSGLSMNVVSEPVWPWVVGAVVTYYAAKKAINYWVRKTFTPKPHVHTQFFIPKEQLEDRINDVIMDSSNRLEGLEQVVNSNFVGPNVLLNSDLVSVAIEEKVKQLTVGLINEVTQYCSVCQAHHGVQDHPFQLHQKTQGQTLSFQPQVQINFLFGSDFKNQVGGIIENSTKERHQENRLFQAKEKISNGFILRTTKAFLLDLKKELVNPLITLLKGTKKVVTDKHSLKQVDSFVKTNFKASLGESNYIAATSIALSLVTIKVLGESIESVFLGPYHILCQISDAAAVAAGIGMFSTYHCLRQPFRKKEPGLLLSSSFWSVLWKKVKNPIKSKVKTKEELALMTTEHILLMEMDNIKANIKTLIWQLHLDGRLSSSTRNSLALNLGRINKNLENLLFDLNLDLEREKLNGKTNLVVFVNKLKPLVLEYQNFYEKMFDQIEEPSFESENTFQAPSPKDTAENLCLSFLNS